MKKVFLFNEVTGEYLDEYLAQESPLEIGKYIEPVCSTNIQPPAFTRSQTCKFKSGRWVIENKPLPDPKPAPTLEELSELVRNALQSAIDVNARLLGFSGGNALMLYAGFSNSFQPLATHFAEWEASVWVEADAYKSEVLAGNKPMLTPLEAVALMPTYP